MSRADSPTLTPCIDIDLIEPFSYTTRKIAHFQWCTTPNNRKILSDRKTVCKYKQINVKKIRYQSVYKSNENLQRSNLKICSFSKNDVRIRQMFSFYELATQNVFNRLSCCVCIFEMFLYLIVIN